MINENRAISMWLDGCELTRIDIFDDDVRIKIHRDPRREKTRDWRRRQRGHKGELSSYVLFEEFGYNPRKRKYPCDRKYAESVSDGYNIRFKKYGV